MVSDLAFGKWTEVRRVLLSKLGSNTEAHSSWPSILAWHTLNTNFLSLPDVLERKSELAKVECEAQAFFMGENKIYAQTSRNRQLLYSVSGIHLAVESRRNILPDWLNTANSLSESFLGTFYNTVIFIRDLWREERYQDKCPFLVGHKRKHSKKDLNLTA